MCVCVGGGGGGWRYMCGRQNGYGCECGGEGTVCSIEYKHGSSHYAPATWSAVSFTQSMKVATSAASTGSAVK